MKAKKKHETVLLTREQTKELLHITQPTLRKWTKLGLLTAYGLGGRIYYKQDEILRALQVITPKIN